MLFRIIITVLFWSEWRDSFAFLPYGQKLRSGSVKPSPATLVRVAFDGSSLTIKRKMQAWHKAIPAFLVRVARLELAASCSQSRRATNCATPGYEIN